MKVALVYDRVNKLGGAEKVLLALHEIWPDAPLYTSVYDKSLTPWADDFEVRTTFLQNSPLPKNRHEYYPFLMGIAFETFNFDEYDVVISVTHEFAKAIITKPQTLHLCYCLTPTSYLWSGYESYFSYKSDLIKLTTLPIIKYLRWYDKIIAHRPDHYIAISKTVQKRIKKYYDQESEIIFPPVEVDHKAYETHKSHESLGNFYLVVSRLVPNKRIDLAIRAFNQLGLPLKIIGSGLQETKLKQLAEPNIEFLGHISDSDLAKYYQNCLALIVPGTEDFGIVSVEAQSYGKPVIAFNSGGSTETVIPGKTGYLFDRQAVNDLVNLIKTGDLTKIKASDCLKNALRFSKDNFQAKFQLFVEKSYEEYTKS